MTITKRLLLLNKAQSDIHNYLMSYQAEHDLEPEILLFYQAFLNNCIISCTYKTTDDDLEQFIKEFEPEYEFQYVLDNFIVFNILDISKQNKDLANFIKKHAAFNTEIYYLINKTELTKY